MSFAGLLGLAGGAAGTGLGLASAFGAADSQQKTAQEMIDAMYRLQEEGAAQRQSVSEQARADQDISRQNLLATESAQLNVLSSLGTPGSYGPSPGSTSGPISLGVLKPTGLSGYNPATNGLLAGDVTKTGRVTGLDVAINKRPMYKGEKDWSVTGANLDPNAMADQVKSTSGFRTVSAMVAEAEQLMNRQGPLWNQLNNSIVGTVSAGAAAASRDAIDQMSRAIAKGGTARRAGLQMAQAFQAQEQINRDKTNSLWQAKANLEELRTTYAKDVTSFAQNWVSNTSGIRDSFTSALVNLQNHWSSTIAPGLISATVGAQSATQTGITNNSQGLYDAINTRLAATQGASQMLMGAGQSLMSGKMPAGLQSLFGGSTPAAGATSAVGGIPTSAAGAFGSGSAGGLADLAALGL